MSGMSNENNAAPQPAQTTGATGAAATPPNGTANNNVSLTQEQVNDLIQKAINPIAAELRRAREGKTETKPAEGAPAGEKLSPAVVEALKKAEEKGNRRLRNAALKEAAAAEGIPATRLDAFKTIFESKYSAQIEIGDDESVSVNTDLGPKPLSEVVKGFLKAPEGEMFRPAKSLPTANSLAGSNSSQSGDRPYFSELPEAERAKMSPADRAAYVAADLKR